MMMDVECLYTILDNNGQERERNKQMFDNNLYCRTNQLKNSQKQKN